MDRLISEEEVIKAICNYKGKFYTVHAISKIPSAYEGMTNGEVMQIVFPYETIYKGEFGYDLGGCTIDFDWWNSPYSEGSDKE